MRTAFAIVTDVHLGPDKIPPYLSLGSFGTQGADLLRLLSVRLRISRPDFILSLGDHVNDRNAKDDARRIREHRELLEESGFPVYMAAGNHDLVNLTDRQAAHAMRIPALQYTFDAGHLRFVVLCPHSRKTRRRRNAVTIGRAQIEWLRSELARSSKPVIVFCHYPLGEPELRRTPYWFYFVPHPWRAMVTNRKEIRQVMESSGKVLAVFSGHLHAWAQQEINGIQYFLVPSLTENRKSRPSGEYALVSVWNRQVLVRRKSVGIYHQLAGRNRKS